MKFVATFNNRRLYLESIRGIFQLTNKEIDMLLILISLLKGEIIMTTTIRKELEVEIGMDYEQLKNKLTSLRKRKIINSNNELHPMIVGKDIELILSYVGESSEGSSK